MNDTSFLEQEILLFLPPRILCENEVGGFLDTTTVLKHVVQIKVSDVYCFVVVVAVTFCFVLSCLFLLFLLSVNLSLEPQPRYKRLITHNAFQCPRRSIFSTGQKQTSADVP